VDAMDINSELQALILSEITRAFDNASQDVNPESDDNEKKLVLLQILALDHGLKTIVVRACLVRAAVVIISNWQDEDEGAKSNELGVKSNDCFRRLLSYLIIPAADENKSGLASALYKHDNAPAASIEDVSHYALSILLWAIFDFFLVFLSLLVDIACESERCRSFKACSTLCPRSMLTSIVTLLWHVGVIIFNHAWSHQQDGMFIRRT
jgi:hypothetical protein